MIRKFVMALVLTMLAGATVQAQQNDAQPNQVPPNQTQHDQAPPPPTAPAQSQPPAASQTPAGQESSSSETSDEDNVRRKKIKTHAYQKWTFNVGGGANLGRGTTKTFVRGGGGLAGVGVARNANKYLGLRLDFQWVDLPLRASALQQAQAPSGSNYVYAFTLDPIISIPVTREYTGYFLIGPSYYHRAGKLDSSTAVPGSACNAFYDWWGSCFNTSLPLNGKFLTESQNEFGFNFGGGVAKKVGNKLEVYGEFRQQHGSRSGITTDWRSITIGVRW